MPALVGAKMAKPRADGIHIAGSAPFSNLLVFQTALRKNTSNFENSAQNVLYARNSSAKALPDGHWLLIHGGAIRCFALTIIGSIKRSSLHTTMNLQMVSPTTD
jgi:hypothetical protein